MSEKKPSFVVQKWFCVLCNREYEFLGGRAIWKPPSPKLKGGFQWIELICKGCGTRIRVGGFIQDEEEKKREG